MHSVSGTSRTEMQTCGIFKLPTFFRHKSSRRNQFLSSNYLLRNARTEKQVLLSYLNFLPPFSLSHILFCFFCLFIFVVIYFLPPFSAFFFFYPIFVFFCSSSSFTSSSSTLSYYAYPWNLWSAHLCDGSVKEMPIWLEWMRKHVTSDVQLPIDIWTCTS
jgi:hypothetical protein